MTNRQAVAYAVLAMRLHGLPERTISWIVVNMYDLMSGFAPSEAEKIPISFTVEELREIYESVPRDYIEVMKQTNKGRLGATMKDLFVKLTYDPLTVSELIKEMHLKAEEIGKGKDIVTWLSSEDRRLIDADKLDKLIYAFYYYGKYAHNTLEVKKKTE